MIDDMCRKSPDRKPGLFRIKLMIPAVSRRLLHRERLDLRLKEGLRGRLMLVTAPAGFGKTTAVASWLRRTNIKAAWFAIDGEDNDLKRFWAYLINSLDAVKPGIKKEYSHYLNGMVSVTIEDIAATLAGELSELDEDFVLVLDDFHNIEDISIHRSLELLIKHLPDNAHIIIISRTLPPLGSVRPEVFRQIEELDAAELRFTSTEISDFCTGKGRNLSKREISSLEACTEGWAAGLAFILDSEKDIAGLSSLPPAGKDGHRIASYLTEEVLDRWSHEEKDFILKTSILTSMTGELCDALTGRSDGAELLKRLYVRSAFISAPDGGDGWYRYHQLFSEFLRSMLIRSGVNVRELHDRAGSWYEENGYLHDAAAHYLEGGLFEKAADAIEKHGRSILGSGDLGVLIDWLSRLPEKILKERDILLFMKAWALLLTDRVQEAIHEIDYIEKKHAGASSTVDGVLTEEQIAGEIAAFRGFVGVKISDPRMTLRSMARFSSLKISRSIFCDYGLLVSRGEASLLASMFCFGGRLSLLDMEFRKIYERTRGIMAEHFGYLPVLAGELLFERNRPDEAMPLLLGGIEEAERSRAAGSLVPAVITMARLMTDRGDLAGAFEILRDGEKKLQGLGSIHLLPQLAACRTRLCILTCDGDVVAEWMERGCLDVSDAPSMQRMYEQITLLRVLLSKNDFDSCTLLLNKLLSYVQQEQHLLYTAELLSLGAILNNALGHTQTALELLRDSLLIGEKEGYARLYIEEGLPMAALLLSFLKWYFRQKPTSGNELSPVYVRGLLKQTRFYCATVKVFAEAPKTNANAPRATKPLTRREREVLRLIGSGLTNTEIASSLNIALNTVKVNCTNIYNKLNVNSREQAVKLSREQRLLD